MQVANKQKTKKTELVANIASMHSEHGHLMQMEKNCSSDLYFYELLISSKFSCQGVLFS
jgi:hypothetical protein